MSNVTASQVTVMAIQMNVKSPLDRALAGPFESFPESRLESWSLGRAVGAEVGALPTSELPAEVSVFRGIGDHECLTPRGSPPVSAPLESLAEVDNSRGRSVSSCSAPHAP